MFSKHKLPALLPAYWKNKYFFKEKAKKLLKQCYVMKGTLKSRRICWEANRFVNVHFVDRGGASSDTSIPLKSWLK